MLNIMFPFIGLWFPPADGIKCGIEREWNKKDGGAEEGVLQVGSERLF